MGQIKNIKLHIVTDIKEIIKNQSQQTTTMVKKPVDPTKPKRPMNAYMMFATQKRKEIVKDHPELKVTEISKMLGAEWRGMSEDEKSPFTKEAKRLKDIYDKAKQ